MGVFCLVVTSVLPLHHLATRGCCCPQNRWALTVFCGSGSFSAQQISKVVKIQQNISVCQSTFCFCYWLQFLVGSDSACSVQLQPDSGPDSEQLHLHRHRLQHLGGAENLLTARWNNTIQHHISSFKTVQLFCARAAMVTTGDTTTTTAATGDQTTIIPTTPVKFVLRKLKMKWQTMLH